jgi:hypothetical protein
MDLVQVLIYIICPIIFGYIGYNERSKAVMKRKLDATLTAKEVEHLIDLKNRPAEVLQAETCKDVKECKDKLDKLMEQVARLNHDS